MLQNDETRSATLASYPAFPHLRFLSQTVSEKNLRHGKAGYEASVTLESITIPLNDTFQHSRLGFMYDTCMRARTITKVYLRSPGW